MQLMLSPLSLAYLNKKMDLCMKKYSKEDGRYLVSMASHYSYYKQLMPSEVYGVPTRIMFEEKLLNAPAEVHDYLTRIYKDYMKIPSNNNLYAVLDQIERVDYVTKNEG